MAANLCWLFLSHLMTRRLLIIPLGKDKQRKEREREREKENEKHFLLDSVNIDVFRLYNNPGKTFLSQTRTTPRDDGTKTKKLTRIRFVLYVDDHHR